MPVDLIRQHVPTLHLPERFELKEQLGAGGQGSVFRVLDREFQDEVALKVLNQTDSKESLKKEFRAISDLNLPGFVRFYELFADHSPPFFTMELVPGEPLIPPDPMPPSPAQLPGLLSRFALLAVALESLHKADRIHRDLKPANILVVPSILGSPERVVILDMGLTRSLLLGHQTERVLGTIAYMAPEQVHKEVKASVDWYSFGVMLFEALTGRLPFDDQDAISKKLTTPAPLASSLASVPLSLDKLIAGLLQINPEHRPQPAQVLAVLQESGAAAPQAWEPPPPPVFIERRQEYEQLQTAFLRSGLRVVLLKGRSGIGKTSLIENFLENMPRDPPITPLKSRCHPDEHAAFKALDPLVEQLIQQLLSIPDSPSLLPAAPHALPVLFPAFRRLLRTPAPFPLPVSPEAQAQAAFSSLKELFCRVCTRLKLVLWIDDVQWADLDSTRLLREICAAYPELMLILSFRSEDEHSPALVEINTLPSSLLIQLGPLSLESCERLGELLDVDKPLLVDTGGSPLIISELARYLRQPGVAILSSSSMVFQARIHQLSPECYRLLAFCSLAVSPLPRSLASVLVGPGLRGSLQQLLSSRMLRSQASSEGKILLEPYHDRIREVMLETITPALRSELHNQLFSVFAGQADVEPQTLLAHCAGAGLAEAGYYAAEAGDQAAGVLAFETAARLYQVALQLGYKDAGLYQKLAESLKNAGRLAEAARAFEETAQILPDKAHQLLQQAAEQYLHAGNPKEGTSLLKRALQTSRIRYPASSVLALLEASLLRFWFFIRGYPKKLTSRTPDPARALLADALWSASTAMAMIDPITSDFFGIRHLLVAIQLGEPSRLCRALGYEAAFEASFGGMMEERSRKLVDEALRLADRTGRQEDTAWAALCAASVFTLLGDFRRAVDYGRKAEQIYRMDCVGADWELAVINLYLLSSLSYLGEIPELLSRVRIASSNTQKRGDVFARNAWRLGQPVLAGLALDQPERVLQQAEESLQEWPTEGGFHTQNLQYLVATALAWIYEASGQKAVAAVDARWKELVAAHYLKFRFARTEVLYVRGRVYLTAAIQESERSLLYQQAVQEAAAGIASWEQPYSLAFSWMLQAGCAAIQKNTALALELLKKAEAALHQEGLRLYRDACRDRMYRLEGGKPGQHLILAQLHADLQDQGIRDPERFLFCLLPWPGVTLPARTATPAAATVLLSGIW